MRLVCDAFGYPHGFILTGTNVSDFDQAQSLLRAHLQPAAYAVMDEGYHSDAIRVCVDQLGGSLSSPCILAERNPRLSGWQSTISVGGIAP